jgi:hypothetical protein
MDRPSLVEKYADQIAGVLNCYDRIVITGSVQPLCYAKGMTKYLYQQGIRIFDYTQFSQPLRDQIRANAEQIASQAGVSILHMRRKNERKEAHVEAIVKGRGDQPGLVCILSAMERCGSYEPWHDKASGKTYVRYREGKCLHYYFYFIDAEFGLCYLRVPTWCPFRLQFYCNGHAWLAHQLKHQGIAYELRDNGFVHLADFDRANALAQEFSSEQLHAKLDEWAKRYCPVIDALQLSCTWSLLQAEHATDIVFKQRADLAVIYPPLVETLIHAVKPADIAMFLGKKLHGNYRGEVSSRLSVVRDMGLRIKHSLGPVSIKMYDKFAQILRIETTISDISFFQQYRQVRHRDGTTESRWSPMKKTIYSLAPLRDIILAANRRYLGLISTFERRDIGVRQLTKLTEPVTDESHRYKGFNPLAEQDTQLFRVLARGEFTLSGLTARALHALLPDKSSSQISRLLKRLRLHGLLKKVGHHYKYYLTGFGRQAIAMVLNLRELHVIPTLSQSHAL